MKPIQVVFDETLLRQLDADEEVRKYGRSAVLRRAAADYLRRAKTRRITAKYRRAYGANPELPEEFEGWPAEGAWPDE
jgi:metal-responsive CopG/Arc/MetJ family transcriptional regulator